MSHVNGCLEELRSSYKPSKIILLLVGESPPPHKGFFYDPAAAEGQLSRNTRKVFEAHFGIEYSNRQNFLDHFKRKDCYLFDVFKSRGKTIYVADPKEKEAAVSELSKFLREEKPKIVVSVLKRTSGLVAKAVQRSQIKVSYRVLPYPTRHYATVYCSGLAVILTSPEVLP